MDMRSPGSDGIVGISQAVPEAGPCGLPVGAKAPCRATVSCLGGLRKGRVNIAPISAAEESSNQPSAEVRRDPNSTRSADLMARHVEAVVEALIMNRSVFAAKCPSSIVAADTSADSPVASKPGACDAVDVDQSQIESQGADHSSLVVEGKRRTPAPAPTGREVS
jgi:hypothetical protein